MDERMLLHGAVAAIVATLGLLWFRLILTSAEKLPKLTQYGIYTIIWLAYFILVMIVIAQPGQ